MATRINERAEGDTTRLRVLIVGSFYAPEPTGIAPYTTGLAEHLAAHGHAVTVITGVPSYPHWRIYHEYRGRLRFQELRGGVDVRRTRNYVPLRHTAAHRGLYEATLLLGALTIRRLPQPDAVLGVLPALSAGVIARTLARRFDAPYGLLFQDLTGQGAWQSGVAGGSRVAGPITAIEGWTAREARVVAVVADGFRQYVESLGVKRQRIHRIRNWVHIAEPTLDPIAVRTRLGLPQDAFVCLHAGNMGSKQGLVNLIECARLAADRNRSLLFTLVGDGNQRSKLVTLAEQYRLPNIRFLPIQPAEIFPSVLAAADVLLINQRSAVTNMSLPGKLTSYFASGRPIVAAVSPDSETAMEIREARSGVLVPPDQPARLLQAIQEVADEPALLERLGAAGRLFARRELSAGHALARIEALIHAIATSSPSNERLAL